MELMLLVYLVENLSYNGTFFMKASVWLLILAALYFIVKVVSITDTYALALKKDSLDSLKIPKRFVTLIAFLLTLHTFLPERQTMIYMVGAYAAQEVLTSDKTKELGGKTYKALSNQLDKWAEEVEIVTENVVSVVKEKVSEELTK